MPQTGELLGYLLGLLWDSVDGAREPVPAAVVVGVVAVPEDFAVLVD